MNEHEEQIGCCFDAYCKRLLRNELIDAYREYKKQSGKEVAFSALSEKEFQQLQYIDEYYPDRRVFPVLNWEVEICDSDLVQALAAISGDRRTIVLLAYLLGLTDQEIAAHMGLNRSSVQRRRKNALNTLRKILEE